MSQQQELEQFIYGKFVGPDSGYRIVAHSSNLEDEQELQKIAEQEYRFWENHSHYNLWGVGICPNNTQTLPEQKMILIQESLARGSRKNALISGSRSFYQRLYVFVSETTTLELNKSIVWWLTKFAREKVPTFTALNEPNDSVDSWDFARDYFSLTDEQTQKANPEKIIADVWQKLSTNERNLWLQTLDAIMSGKKLLIAIADNKDAISKIMPKLDNLLLLFIPIAWRNKLSIAMGKDIDLEVCKWANIVVSFQENAISLPPDWVCLDLASKTITSNHNIESEYVQDFIEPLKEDYENLITLCKKFAENSHVGLNLKTSNDRNKSPDSNNLPVQYQDKPFNISFSSPQDKPLDFSHPSVDFIANYPKDDAYKTQLFSKYIEPMKSELQIFLGNAGKDKEMVLGILWEAIKQNLNTSADLAVLCLGKMFALLTKDEFLKRLWELEAVDCINLISHGLLKELNKEDNLELIKKDLQFLCLKFIKEKRNNYEYEKVKNFVSSHFQEIFASEVEKFKLWDSFFAQKIDDEKFLNLFDEKLIPVMPNIDLETFDKSCLFIFLKNNFSVVASCLQDVLLNRNLSKLCTVSTGLKMNNAATQKLYINFLKSQSPSYESSDDLLIDAISRSINPETTAFEFQDFFEVYQWFNNKKQGLLDILRQLHQTQTNQLWSTWESLSTFLYSANDRQSRVDFLDNAVAQKFPAEVLKTWFYLLASEQNNLKIKESFLNGKAWHDLSEKNLENLYSYLTNDFPDYVGKLIEWGYEKSRLDLISIKLTEYAIEIWETKNKIDENTWQILMRPQVQEHLCNEKRFRMAIAHFLCEQNPLPLTNNVENQDKNGVKEAQEKNESQQKDTKGPFQRDALTRNSPVKKLQSSERSNKNRNKSKVNGFARDLPIYNDEEQETQKSLTDIARQKVNQFNNYPETIESFLQLCDNFKVNILPVLVDVNCKNCPVGLYLNYLGRNNIDKNSPEYIRCFEKMLSQTKSNTKERHQIIDFVKDIAIDMTGEQNKELQKLAVNFLTSLAHKGLK